jgi:hypothetical protein
MVKDNLKPCVWGLRERWQVEGMTGSLLSLLWIRGRRPPGSPPPRVGHCVPAAAGERVHKCVRACTCEMWRRPPRWRVRSAKIRIINTSLTPPRRSRELGGPAGFPQPAGWGRGPPATGGGVIQRSSSAIFPLN